ncbi:MAG: carboxypeptidase regulatory-like domain-containing protein [bacterium]|nr:carboxypeptidase regulatory-like domain-containing protein [bacterium]
MKRLFYILLAGLLFVACDDINEEINVGRISGVVSDKNTGEPVATVSAVLSPGGNSTVTGSDGSFEFVDLSPGEYTVNINKEGYKSNDKVVTVAANQTTQAHLLIERIPAVITADRTELDFGKDYGVNTLSFNIVNNNYEKLSWEMVNNCGWITDVSPKSGSLAYGKTGTIIVKIDRDLLADGNNTTVLVLSTEGVGSTEITVKAYGQAKKKAVLNTLEVSSITATTAVLTGEIVDDGYPKYYERGIVYSEQSMPTVEQTLQRLTATMTDDKAYSCQAVGLTLGKTYYVRAYAVNEMGVAYSSNQVSFTTAAVGGKVTIIGVDDINLTDHTAVAHGEILELGDPAYTERGFVYSHTNSSPTIYNNIVTVEGSGKGTFDAKLTDLVREATYYVRAYVKNEAGVVYSDKTMTFSTEETAPEVETLGATDIDETTHSATLWMNIISVGNPPYTEIGFVYSTEYSTPTILDNKAYWEGFYGAGKIGGRLEGFSSEKATYIRAYATNSRGTVYGETIQLFTPDFIVIPELGIAVQREDIGTGDYYSMESLCKNSTVGGFTDWRLPTKDEMSALYNLRDKIGGFVATGRYWCSTQPSGSGYSKYRYYLEFSSGEWDDCYIGDGQYKRYARAVRTLTE